MPGRLCVQWNGKIILEREVMFFPADAERLYFGANPIGLSTSQPEFTGSLKFEPTVRYWNAETAVTKP